VHAPAEHLLERLRQLCSETLAVTVDEEQGHGRERHLHRFPADTTDEPCDMVEGVIGDAAQLQTENVRILRRARRELAHLIAKPRNLQQHRWQLRPAR